MKKMISYLSIAAFGAATLVSVPATRAETGPQPLAVPVSAQQYGAGYGQEPWANPPSDWKEAQRKGFHDGIEGARQDAKNGRTANVNNRDEFRHPDVPRRDRRAYRDGFRRGYKVGVEHLMRRGYGDRDHDHYHDHDRD